VMGLPGGRGSPIECGVLVTVFRPRAQAAPCGSPVGRPARPAHQPAPGQSSGHRVKPGASLAVRSVRGARGRAPGRVTRGGWSGAPGPAAAGRQRPRRSAPGLRARRDGTPPQPRPWCSAPGRPARRDGIARRRQGLGLGDGHAGQVHGRQCGPEDQCAGEFGHGCPRSINCCLEGRWTVCSTVPPATGPAATNHGPPTAGAGDAAGERHVTAAHRRLGAAVG
jgi:hypothetical protein